MRHSWTWHHAPRNSLAALEDVAPRLSPWLLGVGLAALAVSLCACGEHVVRTDSAPPRFAVLSTFPAEMAPLLAQVTVDHTEIVNGRVFRIGTLAGVPVVLGLTGIGLVNAATTTGELLDRFDVAGVLVSAVAEGSSQQIGDVAVPEAFSFKDGTTYAADPHWLVLAGEIAAAGGVTLERCTVVADPPPTAPVCMLRQPAIVVGGVGRSSDPYGGKPFACIPGGNDLYGCDVPSASATSAPGRDRRALATITTAEAGAPVTEDMETAAIAREAAARGVPFIAFRAVSDGGVGEPLGLSGFLPQFAAYYRFAADNATLATVAFLERLAARN
jgi:nucleoside phosphorylase